MDVDGCQQKAPAAAASRRLDSGFPPEMPPKKEAEKKKKIVEDKTFGLKNKKGAKVAKYVEQVKQQAANSGNRKQNEDAASKKAAAANAKASAEAKKAELAALFAPVMAVQKVPFGVDPKTVLCNAFKQGLCTKGAKCKFSHDKDVERKVEKIDIYADNREADKKKKQSDMDGWDDSMLQAVVSSKQDTMNANLPTEIVCKHFLEAIETRKYGWFWECPNGGKSCKYRHALPPGYVLKKKETEAERREREANEKENAITIEDFLDRERHNLGSNLTPINEETFAKWKRDRKEKQQLDFEKMTKEKAEAAKKVRAGMKSGMALSGKDLFDFNPDWAVQGDDQDEEGAMDVYEREASDHEGEENDPQGHYLGEDGGDPVEYDRKGKGKLVLAEEFLEELDGLEDEDEEDEDDEEEEDEGSDDGKENGDA
ncbi:hypothetical protein HDU84_002723 [Entophlyctis sp. JEL0112]|nr:hypothetical protein HDU84_002723 [Entophlyctis sp. JEL0112]